MDSLAVNNASIAVERVSTANGSPGMETGTCCLDNEPAATKFRGPASAQPWVEGFVIRCVRIWTGDDDNSCFEEGAIEFAAGARDDLLSKRSGAASISFQESHSGSTFAWHDAPARQFVITLSGTLEFTTRKGEQFVIHPGDVLLAEDTTGTGHRWKLLDQDPWRRVYVILAPGAKVPFVAQASPA